MGLIMKSFPLPTEYIDSIKSFKDNCATLTELSPVLSDCEEPELYYEGTGIVFKMKSDANGNFYALKCFTCSFDKGLYSCCVDNPGLIYPVGFQYLENELFVDSIVSNNTDFPVIIYPWIEGLCLNEFLKLHHDESDVVRHVAYNLCSLFDKVDSLKLNLCKFDVSDILVLPSGELYFRSADENISTEDRLNSVDAKSKRLYWQICCYTISLDENYFGGIFLETESSELLNTSHITHLLSYEDNYLSNLVGSYIQCKSCYDSSRNGSSQFKDEFERLIYEANTGDAGKSTAN